MPFNFASPEDLARLEAALQEAWMVIVARHGDDPLSSAGEKERLAYVLAALWRRGGYEDLASRAVQEFEATRATLNVALGKPPAEPAD